MRIFGLPIAIKSLFAAASTIAASPAAQPLIALAGNELDRAVVTAKSGEIGKAAIAAIAAAEVPGASSTAKKAQAIAAVMPVVALHVAQNGLAASVHDLETFAGSVIESTLADLRVTGPAAIAKAVLSLALAAA